MSKKCVAFSKSKLGLETADNRKSFYAGWDAALAEQARHRRFTEEAKVIEKMQQDEIIRMAREAGIPIETDWAGRPSTLVINDSGVSLRGVDDLERFAALVAAHEREKHGRTKDLTDDEINELWLTHGQGQMMYIHEKFARAAIAADREKNRV